MLPPVMGATCPSSFCSRFCRNLHLHMLYLVKCRCLFILPSGKKITGLLQAPPPQQLGQELRLQPIQWCS
jgi:hypothetical protein